MSTLEELLKPRPEDVFGIVQISMDPGGWKELPVKMLGVIKGMVNLGAELDTIDGALHIICMTARKPKTPCSSKKSRSPIFFLASVASRS